MTDLAIPNRTPEQAQARVDELDLAVPGWRFWRWAERPSSLLRAALEERPSDAPPPSPSN